MAGEKNIRRCAFCTRSEEEVSFLIPARDGRTYICDDCISVCADFIDEQRVNLDGADEESLSFAQGYKGYT